MSSVNRSRRVVVVGLDPGVTTGIALLKGNLGNKYSSGLWACVVGQHHVDGLAELGGEVIESGWGDLDWWSRFSKAGLGLCMTVYGALMEECPEVLGGDGAGEVQAMVVMEDFILRPEGGAKGIGGRNVLSPVALGAAFMALWMQMVDGQRVPVHISPPSAKSLIKDQQIKRWFGDGVGRGKPHGMDALRHALLGVRVIRGK